jgi:hypothetical protein
VRIGLLLLAIFAASPAVAADLAANPQFWGELDVSADLAPDWRLTALSVAREGDALPDPTLWGGGAILDRRFGDLTVSLGDLAVAVRGPVSGASLDVDVPLAAVSYARRIGGFEVADRNRIEDLIGVPGDPWRYRNRLSVERPVSGLGPLSSIFASEEVFYDLQAHDWSRSRAQIGVAIAAAPHTELRLFYLRQDDRSGLPRAVNALGVTLAFDLR